MRKVEFIKTKDGVFVYLDNSLFKNETEQTIKINKMFKLFSDDIARYEGTIFIGVKDISIIDDLYKMNCSVELISTIKSIILKRDKEKEYKIIFENDQMEQIIYFLLKNDLTFSGNGYKNNGEILLNIVINDHDGSFITFNDKTYKKENYKELINNIIKN